MSPDRLAPYSRGTTGCHRLSPTIKLSATLAFAAVVFQPTLEQWPMLVALFAGLIAMHAWADISAGFLARRVLGLWPFFGALGLGMVWSGPGGVERWLLVTARGTLLFLATLWLVNTTPFPILVGELRRWGVPRMFLEIVMLAWRYISVLLEELGTLRTARRARTLSRASTWDEWVGLARSLGMLLIRSLDRAERIHQAMQSRGGDL
jgi:cobalt/nickel transport system permease protein